MKLVITWDDGTKLEIPNFIRIVKEMESGRDYLIQTKAGYRFVEIPISNYARWPSDTTLPSYLTGDTSQSWTIPIVSIEEMEDENND